MFFKQLPKTPFQRKGSSKRENEDSKTEVIHLFKHQKSEQKEGNGAKSAVF